MYILMQIRRSTGSHSAFAQSFCAATDLNLTLHIQKEERGRFQGMGSVIASWGGKSLGQMYQFMLLTTVEGEVPLRVLPQIVRN